MPSIVSADPDDPRQRMLGKGDVQVEGKVFGRIEAGYLIVAEGGEVEGDIVAKTVVIAGSVRGSIKAGTVTLSSTARVQGGVVHDVLAIEAGAQLEGECRRLAGAQTDKIGPAASSSSNRRPSSRPPNSVVFAKSRSARAAFFNRPRLPPSPPRDSTRRRDACRASSPSARILLRLRWLRDMCAPAQDALERLPICIGTAHAVPIRSRKRIGRGASTNAHSVRLIPVGRNAQGTLRERLVQPASFSLFPILSIDRGAPRRPPKDFS